MSGNSFGNLFKISTFGESHGKAVGVVLDGCPPNIEIDESDIQAELNRRRPGQSSISTPRDETDTVEILSGVFEGRSTGMPIMMVVFNKDQRSKDYSKIKDVFRPGHADFTYQSKYGIRDYRGSGRSSARETIGRVCGGAVAKKLLAGKGVSVTAHVTQVGNIKAEKCDFGVIEQNPVRCADASAAVEMEKYITEIKDSGDSIGGIVEVVIKGVPVGLGEPVFDRINAELAKAIYSIPAVKALEFGVGFKAAEMKGSEMGDEMSPYGFMSNNAGGTLGGISNGNDIVFRFALKGPSSIKVPKKSVNLYGKEVTVITEGRHDPCVAPRAVPVAESMSALVMVDMMMIDNAWRNLF